MLQVIQALNEVLPKYAQDLQILGRMSQADPRYCEHKLRQLIQIDTHQEYTSLLGMSLDHHKSHYLLLVEYLMTTEEKIQNIIKDLRTLRQK